MRFLLLSLEFDAGTFSGNGVYACSQSRALTQLGHEVLVVAGRPSRHAAAEAAQAPERHADLVKHVIYVELPVWGRLDAGCAWQEYGAGAAAADVAAAVAAFRPAAVLGVDWHSVAAYDKLAPALPERPPFVYLNYRVYHRTATPEELAVIEAQEERALRLARCSLVLSRSDADYLCRHFPDALAQGGGALHVLLPALRSDMERLPPPPPEGEEEEADAGAADAARRQPGMEGAPQAAEAGTQGATAAAAAAAAHGRLTEHSLAQQGGGTDRRRRFLTCCVRLSPEKEPHRFVELAVELQRRGALDRLGVVPLMAGAGWDTPYGQEQRARVQAGVPQCVIHDAFMGPAELAAVYASTALNLHPPSYDAFGMTIVEAASQGAPSLVSDGGHVGATDLLSAEEGEVLVCDMSQPISQLADRVEVLLSDRPALAAVGRRAQAKARSWGEHDNAAALVGYVSALVGPAGVQ